MLENLIADPHGMPESLLASIAFSMTDATLALKGPEEADNVIEDFVWRHPQSEELNAMFQKLDQIYAMERDPSESELQKWMKEKEERRATLTYGALPSVNGSRMQIIQLFQNLIANAIRHCERPVTIHVDFEDDRDGWRLAVRDDGPGIRGDDLAKIFDPFRRLSQRKGEEPGLGLGLAISRKIVESHGGKLWCESKLGEGARFM